MRPHIVRRTLVTLGTVVLAAPLVGPAAGYAAPGGRVTVPGTTPAWATPTRASGTPAASDRVSFVVALPLRDAAAAEQLARDVSDPGSSAYGHYLTSSQFNARFAPTDTAVSRVRDFLTGAGLTVDGVAEGNRWVSASGTVAQVDRVFNTVLTTYSYAGRQLVAPATAVSVPASVSADVAQVAGLDDGALLRHPFHHTVAPDGTGPRAAAASPRAATPSAAKPPASTCSSYWGEHTQTAPAAYGKTTFPTYICGYTPKQLQSAYGVSRAIRFGLDGRGVDVAIVDAYASPTMRSDADAYAQAMDQPTFRRGQYTERVFRPFTLQDECGGEDGWNGEETLDVEAVHALAPGATIHYVGAANCDTGLDDALNYVVQHHVADIVSDSWGNVGEEVSAAEVALEHSIFIQGAVEGIGFYFSSGDYGDEAQAGNTTHPEADFPASDPMVTAVGGTSIGIDKHSRYQFETGWGTAIDRIDVTGPTAVYAEPLPGDFYAGAGGGTSMIFDQPWYQRRTVPDALARAQGGGRKRVVPDVAADGDPYTGFAIGRTVGGTFQLSAIGGTSLACPLFAAVQALASTGRWHPIGFANPLLYRLARVSYRDVRPHSTVAVTNPSGSYLATFDQDTSLATARGYDDVTGLGSPRGLVFVLAELLHW